MHESGHGVYEQGLPREHSFSPVGTAVSLGVPLNHSRGFGKIKSEELQHFGTLLCLGLESNSLTAQIGVMKL